ncbi:MAG: DNA-3-methyladenine glycosylase I [Oceanicaulis sp.]
MIERCSWCGTDPVYVTYHDTEWGVPEYESRALFEKLVLDGFQAGLSWITILKKRENFRRAFDRFDPEKIARYTETDIERLLGDAGIVRSRAKIEAAIKGARIWCDIQDGPRDFSSRLWDVVDGAPVQNRWRSMADVPTQTPASEAMSKDLKRLGFKFCGPVIVYAFMQACGLVNDHVVACHRHAPVARMGERA